MPADPVEEGDREAVLRLFLQHQAMLGGYLACLSDDWEIVEEALQETAVFVCSRWREFDPGSNLPAWLRAIARLRCLEAIRRRRPAGAVDADRCDLAADLDDADWAACDEYGAEHQAALARCLAELPERDRQLIEQRYLRQASCAAIAAAIGRSCEALYMSLSRLRRRLRACVEKRVTGAGR